MSAACVYQVYRSERGFSGIAMGLFLLVFVLVFLAGLHLSTRFFTVEESGVASVTLAAAMAGAHLLPFNAEAEYEARKFMRVNLCDQKNRGVTTCMNEVDSQVRVNISDENDLVEVTFLKKIPVPLLGLLSFFNDEVTSDGLFLEAEIKRAASVSPRDVVILIDNSYYLGPYLAEGPFSSMPVRTPFLDGLTDSDTLFAGRKLRYWIRHYRDASSPNPPHFAHPVWRTFHTRWKVTTKAAPIPGYEFVALSQEGEKKGKNLRYFKDTLESFPYPSLTSVGRTTLAGYWRGVTADQFIKKCETAGVAPSKCRGRFGVVFAQHCFNPVFSAMKEVAFNLYQYLVSVQTNRVALLSGPARDGQIFEVRPLSSTKEGSADTEANIDETPHEVSFLSDADCREVADDAYLRATKPWLDDVGLNTPVNSTYAAGDPTQKLPAHTQRKPSYFGYPPLAQSRPVTTVDFRNPAHGTPLLGFQAEEERDIEATSSASTARRAIWSKAVNPRLSLDISKAIRAIEERVPPAGSSDAGLFQAFLFLGDFPQEGGVPLFRRTAPEQAFVLNPDGTCRETGEGGYCKVRKEIRMNEKARNSLTAALNSLAKKAVEQPIWLTFVILRHEGMSNSCAGMSEMEHPQFYGNKDCREYSLRAARFATFLNKFQSDNFRVIAANAPSAGALVHDVGSFLPLLGKQIVPG